MPRRKIDITGQKFFRLTVLERAGTAKSGGILWLCKCDCGATKAVRAADLIRAGTKSCGCWRRENIKNICSRLPYHPNLTHGHTTRNTRGGKVKVSPSFSSWTAMKQRCLDSNAEKYPYYGGKDVTICDRWLGKEGFQNFISDLGERLPDTTLGRFNDVGDYTPLNCKWMTQAEQVANWRPDRIFRNGTTAKRYAVETIHQDPSSTPTQVQS